MHYHQRLSREVFVPSAIYLSISSTGGDKLLFHYPYDARESTSQNSTPLSSPMKSKDAIDGKIHAAENPANVSVSNEPTVTRFYRYNEDIRRWRQQSESSTSIVGTEISTPAAYLPVPTPMGHSGEIDTAGALPYNISGSTLASLFMSRVDQKEPRIELRIEDTLFVGHPCPVDVSQSEQAIHRFSIVFELHPLAPRSAIDVYHQLARHITFAFRIAERRTLYVSNQKDLIQQIFDQIGEQAESEQPSPFDMVLEKSSLCQEIRAIHESIQRRGQVNLCIDGCIPVSFCVPHLSYRMATAGNIFVEPEAVKAAVNNIQPYQGLMLLDPEDVKASLMPDSNPTMLRFIKHLSPYRSLRQVALQTDLTYSHVFQLAANLVYWGKAIIIYPLCETNRYELVPDIDLVLNEKVAADFHMKFPSLNLIKILGEFCQPIAVTDVKAEESVLSHDWEEINVDGPSIAFHAGVILGDYFYCHGGIDKYQSTHPLAGFFRCHLPEGTWEGLPDGPTLSHHAAVAGSENHILLIGGWNGHERVPDVHIFDVDKKSWRLTSVSGFPSGAGLSSHTATATSSGDIVIIGREGGLRTQRRSGNSYILSGNISKGRFHYEPAPIGTASRSGHCTSWLTGASNLIVTGGRDDKIAEIHHVKRGNSVPATAVGNFINSGKGKRLSKTPGGRKNHSAMAGPDSSLLIYGGETFDGRSKGPVGDFLLLMTKPGLSFLQIGQSNVKRAGAVCCVHASTGRAYLHGGLGPKYAVERQLFVL